MVFFRKKRTALCGTTEEDRNQVFLKPSSRLFPPNCLSYVIPRRHPLQMSGADHRQSLLLALCGYLWDGSIGVQPSVPIQRIAPLGFPRICRLKDHNPHQFPRQMLDIVKLDFSRSLQLLSTYQSCLYRLEPAWLSRVSNALRLYALPVPKKSPAEVSQVVGSLSSPVQEAFSMGD